MRFFHLFLDCCNFNFLLGYKKEHRGRSTFRCRTVCLFIDSGNTYNGSFFVNLAKQCMTFCFLIFHRFIFILLFLLFTFVFVIMFNCFSYVFVCFSLSLPSFGIHLFALFPSSIFLSLSFYPFFINSLPVFFLIISSPRFSSCFPFQLSLPLFNPLARDLPLR